MPYGACPLDCVPYLFSLFWLLLWLLAGGLLKTLKIFGFIDNRHSFSLAIFCQVPSVWHADNYIGHQRDKLACLHYQMGLFFPPGGRSHRHFRAASNLLIGNNAKIPLH
ncbi:hypothetical protein DFP73DRAFT_47731 [Morchella snyderi]|nr:hypothetical protein DFP73DRAFT_47731 [Morchella snyderi]